MFTGNKLVVLLPVLLMVFLFAGGSYYINQSSVVTNDNLDEEIEWETVFEETEKGALLEASWNWTSTPSDGLTGEDFIGITLLDDQGEPMSQEVFDSFELVLESNDGNIVKEGQVVDNGVFFSFPNEIQENATLGSKGFLEVRAHGSETPAQAIISYLHTWEEHKGLRTEDARFFESEFVGKEESDESFFWVMERFVDLKKGL